MIIIGDESRKIVHFSCSFQSHTPAFAFAREKCLPFVAFINNKNTLSHLALEFRCGWQTHFDENGILSASHNLHSVCRSHVLSITLFFSLIFLFFNEIFITISYHGYEYLFTQAWKFLSYCYKLNCIRAYFGLFHDIAFQNHNCTNISYENLSRIRTAS